MTSLLEARYVRIAGLAVGAVAIAGAAIAVTASAAGMTFGFRPSTAPPTSSPNLTAVDASASSTVCTDFMKNFAVEIGRTQAQINTAFQKAVADTLAGEVRSGKITQAQADASKKKLAGQTPCTLPANLGRTGKGEGKARIAAYIQQYLSAAASALGISQSQLTSDLKAGQSLSEVAAAQRVSEADFRSKLILGLKPALDQAVTSKTITAAQEQAILNQLQNGALPLWNTPTQKQPKPAANATPSPGPKTA